MEKQEKNRMILSITENLELCEWLMERGLVHDECACILCELECGDTFALALARIFTRRKQLAEIIHEKSKQNNITNPVIS